MAIIKTFKVLACCLKTPLVIPVPNPEKNDKKAIKKDTYFFLLIISPPLEVVAKASEKNGTTKTRRHKVYSGLAQAPPGRQKSLSLCLRVFVVQSFMLFATPSSGPLYAVMWQGSTNTSHSEFIFCPHQDNAESQTKSRAKYSTQHDQAVSCHIDDEV